MRCRAFFAVVAIMLIQAPALFGQKNDGGKFRVGGRVVDKATGAPVQTAVVRFEDLQRAVVADSLGRFVFNKVPQGTYYVEIARLGYQSTMDFVRVVADNDSVLVQLEPRPIVLEAVTALANQLARRRDRLPTMVRAFDSKKLATSTTNLHQFLSTHGVHVTSCGGGRTRPIDDNCVVSRGQYRPLRVVLNEMPTVGAPLDLYYPHEFELVEYIAGSNSLRLYTTAFLERVAQGKAQIHATF